MSQVMTLRLPKTSPKSGMSRMNSGILSAGMRGTSGVPADP